MTLFPKEAGRDRRRRACGEGPAPRGASSRDVSFELRRGEIVGLAGFVGSGRTEVARAIFGIDASTPAQSWIDGAAVPSASPRGGASPRPRVPARGPAPPGARPADVGRANTSMAVLPELTPAGVLRPRRERALAREVHGGAADQGDLAGPGRAQPLRRQPAEGRARQVARRRAADPHPRRADARRRRGHEGRRPPDDLAPRRARPRRSC